VDYLYFFEVGTRLFCAAPDLLQELVHGGVLAVGDSVERWEVIKEGNRVVYGSLGTREVVRQALKGVVELAFRWHVAAYGLADFVVPLNQHPARIELHFGE